MTKRIARVNWPGFQRLARILLQIDAGDQGTATAEKERIWAFNAVN